MYGDIWVTEESNQDVSGSGFTHRGLIDETVQRYFY